jgi:hypothetical protein
VGNAKNSTHIPEASHPAGWQHPVKMLVKDKFARTDLLPAGNQVARGARRKPEVVTHQEPRVGEEPRARVDIRTFLHHPIMKADSI